MLSTEIRFLYDLQQLLWSLNPTCSTGICWDTPRVLSEFYSIGFLEVPPKFGNRSDYRMQCLSLLSIEYMVHILLLRQVRYKFAIGVCDIILIRLAMHCRRVAHLDIDSTISRFLAKGLVYVYYPDPTVLLTAMIDKDVVVYVNIEEIYSIDRVFDISSRAVPRVIGCSSYGISRDFVPRVQLRSVCAICLLHHKHTFP